MIDTTPEADHVWHAVLRRLGPHQRWRILADAWRTARALHAAGLRRRRPGIDANDIHADWLATVGGGLSLLSRDVVMPPPSNIEVLQHAAALLDRLGIGYALSGSMASSMHGEPRFTQDADILVEPFADRQAAFVGGFGPDWYVSAQAVADALRTRGLFNVIHTSAGFKLDFYVRKDDPFEESALARALALALADDGPAIRVLTAEDVVLFKLRWFRLGQEVATQQWSDILGVLRKGAESIDVAYLTQWALRLGVQDLMQRALAASAANRH